jgi:hypothetical protein
MRKPTVEHLYVYKSVKIQWLQNVRSTFKNLVFDRCTRTDENNTLSVKNNTLLFDSCSRIYENNTLMFKNKTLVFDCCTRRFKNNTLLFENKTLVFDYCTRTYENNTRLFKNNTCVRLLYTYKRKQHASVQKQHMSVQKQDTWIRLLHTYIRKQHTSVQKQDTCVRLLCTYIWKLLVRRTITRHLLVVCRTYGSVFGRKSLCFTSLLSTIHRQHLKHFGSCTYTHTEAHCDINSSVLHGVLIDFRLLRACGGSSPRNRAIRDMICGSAEAGTPPSSCCAVSMFSAVM